MPLIKDVRFSFLVDAMGIHLYLTVQDAPPILAYTSFTGSWIDAAELLIVKNETSNIGFTLTEEDITKIFHQMYKVRANLK